VKVISEEYLVVGRIVKPHGLLGEVKAILPKNIAEIFTSFEEVIIATPAGREIMTTTAKRVRATPKGYLIAFEAISLRRGWRRAWPCGGPHRNGFQRRSGRSSRWRRGKARPSGKGVRCGVEPFKEKDRGQESGGGVTGEDFGGDHLPGNV